MPNKSTRRTYPRVLDSFYNTHWAITPDKLDEIEAAMLSIIAARTQDGWFKSLFDDDEDGSDEPGDDQQSDIKIIPVNGTITPRPSVFSCGWTSTERLGQSIDAAVKNPSVKNIVLDINSPGGSVFGMQEVAAKIRAAREVKPVYAVANHMAASGAYWIGSQASQFIMSPSGSVGSVGVLYRRVDNSAALEKEGIKVHSITSGQYKDEGAPHKPMTDAEHKDLQAKSDAYYRTFVSEVAMGRKKTDTQVRETFANGRMYLAEEAMQLGMVDRVQSFEEFVTNLKATSARSRMAMSMRIGSQARRIG